MGFSIWIDWINEFKNNPNKWDNVGRSILMESCNHHNKETGKDENKARYYDYCEECSICGDSAEPMMNYIYPLETKPDDEKILKVVKNTNCSVMYNNDEDAYFLVLCGGGMDLSQDIAISYIWLEKWIPYDLLIGVSSQEGLSISKEYFAELKKEVIEQAEHYKNSLQEIKDKWK